MSPLETGWAKSIPLLLAFWIAGRRPTRSWSGIRRLCLYLGAFALGFILSEAFTISVYPNTFWRTATQEFRVLAIEVLIFLPIMTITRSSLEVRGERPKHSNAANEGWRWGRFSIADVLWWTTAASAVLACARFEALAVGEPLASAHARLLGNVLSAGLAGATTWMVAWGVARWSKWIWIVVLATMTIDLVGEFLIVTTFSTSDDTPGVRFRGLDSFSLGRQMALWLGLILARMAGVRMFKASGMKVPT